jgi:transposase
MKDRHRRGDPGFNARLALEAIKGVKTIEEVAKGFDACPVQISEWKKPMANNAASGFGAGPGKTDAEGFEQVPARFHARFGRQAIELDWLKKKIPGNSGCVGSCRVDGERAPKNEHEKTEQAAWRVPSPITNRPPKIRMNSASSGCWTKPTLSTCASAAGGR